MVEYEALEQIAREVQRDLYYTFGETLCLISEPHQAFMVIDKKGNIVFMWGGKWLREKD